MRKDGYKKALVIFIDILGSQNRNDFDELLSINELFHSELLENQKENREYVAYHRHVYTFSDCAYIFYDYNDNLEEADFDLGSLFEVALCNCEPLLMKFLCKGLVFRGGVTFGDIFYKEDRNMFFGEAINKAYTYESKIAKNPRIVIDKYVAETVIRHFEKTVKHYNKSIIKYPKSDGGCIVKQDIDGQYYMHFLNSIQHGTDYHYIIGKENNQFVSDIIAFCDAQIVTFSRNPNIRSKYEWLKNYVEQSSSGLIKDPVMYQKPFWDKVLNRVPKERLDELSTQLWLNTMPNVGPLYDEDEQLKIFEKFTRTDIWDALKKIGESDE